MKYREPFLALVLMAGCGSSSMTPSGSAIDGSIGMQTPDSSRDIRARDGAGTIDPPDGASQGPRDAQSQELDTASNDASKGASDGAFDGPRESRPPGQAFAHPGVIVNRAQLDFIRMQIKAGAQPWKKAYDQAMASFGSLDYQAQPFAIVECGSRSHPDIGCSPEIHDAVAAYTHALAWYVTGEEAHAKKAIQILNAWGAMLKSHTNSNAPLQAGWGGALWPLGAEIIRYTYGGWAPADVKVFSTMLRDAFLPTLLKGSGSNGNWELVMIEAAAKIAVFIEDRATLDKALDMWRKRLPAYFYLKSDGPTPVSPPTSPRTGAALVAYWQGQTTYVDGLAQETCRDLGHTQYGITSALAVAETAFQQGIDLYQEQSERLRAAMEFHADYLLGKPVPSWLCGGTLNNYNAQPTWEIGYNHFYGRLGLELPRTKQLIETKVRMLASGTTKHMVWETLTHAGTGRRGFE